MIICPDGNVPASRQAAVNLINHIQFTYNISSPLWGLNMRWPITSSCPHPMRSLALPCRNQACGRMTYPTPGQSSFDKKDLRKDFLCGYCQDWKLEHQGNLPSKQQIAIYEAKKDGTHRKDTCEHCGDTTPGRCYSLFDSCASTCLNAWMCFDCTSNYRTSISPSLLLLMEK